MIVRGLYSVVFYLLIPLVVLRLLWRAIKAPAYAERWAERFGFTPKLAEKPRLWLHAVSVGETLAAVPMIKQLLQRYPEHQLLITTTTPTGSERVQSLFAGEARIEHCYAPYDLPDCLSRFLNRVRPQKFIVMETELWPNTVAACAKRSIPVVVANARLSPKSARGYAKFSALTAPMLKRIDCVAAQNKDDGARFVELGLPAEQLQVTGSIKFDLDLPEALRQRAAAIKGQWSGGGERPVWLVASTHLGEDEKILQAFAEVKKQQGNLLLVLVPRHPERFNSVFELCQDQGYKTLRRSDTQTDTAVIDRDCDILLGDTMGELLLLMGASDMVFVGGSLVPVGGHNLIEPAAWGLPVLTGSALHNFTEVARLLCDADAVTVVDNSAELAQALITLLANPQRAQALGSAAKQVADDNRGALQRLLKIVDEI